MLNPPFFTYLFGHQYDYLILLCIFQCVSPTSKHGLGLDEGEGTGLFCFWLRPPSAVLRPATSCKSVRWEDDWWPGGELRMEAELEALEFWPLPLVQTGPVFGGG